MEKNDFDKLQRASGGLLSFNNFLSTSTDMQVSQLFAESCLAMDNAVAIFFEIELGDIASSCPFASLDNLSYYRDSEKEILFSMHSVFRIGEISQMENGVWHVQLKLTTDDDQQLRRLTEHTREKVTEMTGLLSLGRLMVEMGEWKKSKEIYETMLADTAADDAEELGRIHHMLGFILRELGELDLALSHYEQTRSLFLSRLPADHPELLPTLTNIGNILRDKGDFDGALMQHRRCLEIDSQAGNQERAAFHYNNIAMTLKAQGCLTEALNNFECSLNIRLEILPPTHPMIASTYSNIAAVYQDKKEHSRAIDYMQKCLAIRRKSLPPQHSSLGLAHFNIACAYDALGRNEEAIEHAQLALNIAKHNYPDTHPHVIRFQSDLDEFLAKR
jgi:tetratricopeptide (TPR) repeat protein